MYSLLRIFLQMVFSVAILHSSKSIYLLHCICIIREKKNSFLFLFFSNFTLLFTVLFQDRSILEFDRP